MINNSVADYRTEVKTCEKCNGVGLLMDASKTDVRFILWDMKRRGISHSFRKVVYLTWKKDGVIVCPECGGKGRWEEKV